MCSTPAGCTCPAGTAKVTVGTTTTVTTTSSLGPGTILIGTCKTQTFFVAAGTTNINTNTHTTTTATCTRGDALAAGASYPPITLTVSIAATAPDSLTNVVTVSGGGDVNAANNTASDPTTVAVATIPTLSGYAQAIVVLVIVVTGGDAPPFGPPSALRREHERLILSGA